MSPRQVGLLRGLLYVGSQCGGAVAGAAILSLLLPGGNEFFSILCN